MGGQAQPEAAQAAPRPEPQPDVTPSRLLREVEQLSDGRRITYYSLTKPAGRP